VWAWDVLSSATAQEVGKANLDLMIFFFFSAGYIGEFELVDDHRAGKIVVELNGRLNKCGVISPRYNIGVAELEDWTARLLPSRQVCSPTAKISFLV
jgi:ribosomal protein S8